MNRYWLSIKGQSGILCRRNNIYRGKEELNSLFREVKRSLKWMMSIIKYVFKSYEKEDREERKG